MYGPYHVGVGAGAGFRLSMPGTLGGGGICWERKPSRQAHGEGSLRPQPRWGDALGRRPPWAAAVPT